MSRVCALSSSNCPRPGSENTASAATAPASMQREVVAQDRDQRRAGRVAQRVAEQDAPVRQAPHRGADDVVLIEHADQGGAQLPGDVGGDRQAEGQARQDDVLSHSATLVVGPTYPFAGNIVIVIGEKDHQDDPDHERRAASRPPSMRR